MLDTGVANAIRRHGEKPFRTNVVALIGSGDRGPLRQWPCRTRLKKGYGAASGAPVRLPGWRNRKRQSWVVNCLVLPLASRSSARPSQFDLDHAWSTCVCDCVGPSAPAP